MNYIDEIVNALAGRLDDCEPELLRCYALLVLVKGGAVTEEDVHDAWSVWRTASNPSHPALVPFDQLAPSTQALDTPYAEAIRSVVKESTAGDP